MEVGLALLVCAFGGVAHRFGPLVDAARFASTASASELRSKVPQRGREQGEGVARRVVRAPAT